MINVKWRKREMMKLTAKADEAGESGCQDEPAERLAPPEFGDQSGGVGADAKKGRVAQRNNAGIAQDDVER
jgi:hypothetical protein